MLRAAVWLLVGCCFTGGVRAQTPPLPAARSAARVVYSPRVVSPHNADAYSLRAFRDFPRWRHLQGDALAYEVYRYLADPATGLFHMNVVSEGSDDLGEFTQIRDPVKILNVYGYAYCGILGPTMAGICQGLGIGPSRTLTLPAWNHVAAETYYDNAWHYVDIDVRAVFRRPDGRLASLDEAREETSLWGQQGPLFFPNDDLERTRKIYHETPVDHYHDFHQTGHTMDYVLRPGERFRRWWQPQGGRWHHLSLYHQEEWLRRLLESEPRGPKPNHRHFTVHNHGNGQFVYQPDLTDRSSDFASGVYAHRNVHPAAAGLTLTEPGEGYAVFEVRSPYVIVPLVGRFETTDDDREASVIEADATGVRLGISLDNGLTWEELAQAGEPGRWDLTPQVSGRYGYLLRIGLRGNPGQAVLRSLRITTWVQVAPAALPRLGRGPNRLELRVGDDYGLPSRVIEIRSQASRPEEFLKYLTERPADYDPQRSTAKVQGAVTVQVSAPPGSRVAWFTAAAQFRTHLAERAANTRNAIAYAVAKPTDFRTVYRAHVPTYTDHWHYNAAAEVRLEEPADTLYVRYNGDPAFNNFAIYAHCVDDDGETSTTAGFPTPVRITHTWYEDGQLKSQSVQLDEPRAYEIETQAEPVNESIEIAAESSQKR